MSHMNESAKLADLTPDANNANRGTERGRYMLEQSLRKLGAARSIVLDKHGQIIAGNKTAEAAAAIDLDDVIIVRTNGKQLVAVMREDLDLNDPTGQARELAFADNRVAQVDIDLSADAIMESIAAGLDLGDFYYDWEIAQFTAGDVDVNEAWKGMPEFEQEAKEAYQTIKVHFLNEQDVRDFADLIDQPLTDKTISVYYPQKRPENLKPYRAADES